MNFHFSFFEVVLLIGIAQGFFVSVLIWSKKYNDKSKIFLSAILVVFNLLVCKTLLHSTGLWQTPLFRYIPSSFELLIQPLIWFYINTLVFKNFKISKKQVLHFLPFILFFSYCLFVYFLTQQTKVFQEKDLIAKNLYFNEIKRFEDVLSILSSLLYLLFGVKLILSYQKWYKNNTSNTDFQTFRWLKILIPIFIILILILMVMIGYEFFSGADNTNLIYRQIFFTYLAFVIYFLGFKGYSLETLQLEMPINIDKNEEKSERIEEFEKIKAIILNEFEKNKVYLDPDLNIQKLADNIKINQNVVSQVINQSFNKSFRTFVNDFRINEVKNRLADPASRKLTLVGLAFESGFNSEASFYRIFKSAVGVSPKTYFEQLGN